MKILSEQQESILKEERQLLNDLRVALVQFEASDADQKTLGDTLAQLDELFLLVIVGEFNAGKSAFINALLGKKLLKEGVTPTTTQIQMIRHGDEQSVEVINEHQHVIALPVELLRELTIVDTPGTNAIIREHEEITSQFVPRSDMVLFITSADRPFTESERVFLNAIRNWGKKVVFVINKTDIVQSGDDLAQIIEFVTLNARTLLGVQPEVFPVSARKALLAKQGEPALWKDSGFDPLETYIRSTLDEKGRLRLKLLSPLGVGQHLIDKYLQVTEDRLVLLKDDFKMLSDVEEQQKFFREDMQRDFQFRIADIENILLEMEQRGDEFFEETYRLGRIFDLLSKDRIQKEFEHRVVADVPQQIERKVGELIDWLVDANLRQWRAVTEHIADRRRQHQARIVGDAGGGSFHFDRERLMDAMGREALRVVDTYDKTVEAQEIANGAQTAVAASLAVEAGAVGMGTLITVLASTAAADITGIAAASLVAALGLFIIPTKRVQAKKQMAEKVSELRSKLIRSLKDQFEREIDRGLNEISETIAPYTRFVRAEREKIETTHAAFQVMNTSLDQLTRRVDLME